MINPDVTSGSRRILAGVAGVNLTPKGRKTGC
jgi:hypothetical protein